MYFKDVAYALKSAPTLDNKYRPVSNYTEELFYCNRKSVGSSEFYQSAAVGYKPEVKLEAKLLSLDNISHIKFEGKIYKILRAYPKEDLIELVLTSTVIESTQKENS